MKSDVTSASAKRDRRGDILAAATRLFGARGYGSTTTDQIAEAALVTKRTLYRHTGSKEQILLLIHERFLDAVDAVGEDWTEGGAEQRFRRLVEAYLRVVVDHQDAIRVFYEEMKNLSPASRAKVVERRDGFEASVRQLIADGVANREFRAVDVPVAASAILGGMANCYRWYSPSGSAKPEEIAATATQLFLSGLSAPATVRGTRSGGKAGFRLGEEITGAIDDSRAARELPQYIIDAGLSLFVANGYMETSTQEISDRAGVTKSALFYHIRSKEELLFAIQEDLGHKSLALVADHLGSVPTPKRAVEALRSFIIAHCEIMDSEHQAVEVFIDQLRYLQGRNRERIVGMQRRYAAALRQVIEYGVAGGSLRTENPKVAALLILSMLNSLYRWYRREGRMAATQIGESFADLILNGLVRRR